MPRVHSTARVIRRTGVRSSTFQFWLPPAGPCSPGGRRLCANLTQAEISGSARVGSSATHGRAHRDRERGGSITWSPAATSVGRSSGTRSTGSASSSSWPLVAGDEGFVARHLERLTPSPEYPRACLTQPRQSLEELVASSADAAAITHAYLDHGYSMREIATHLGCGVATIHRRIRIYETAMRGTWKT